MKKKNDFIFIGSMDFDAIFGDYRHTGHEPSSKFCCSLSTVAKDILSGRQKSDT